MTYYTRIAFRVALIAFIVFTLGMATSTIVEGYAGKGNVISYYIYGVGLGLCLFLISCAITCLAKPYKSWYLTFQLFLTLSFINLADEITNAADVIKANELFIGVGVIYYFVVLINKTLIQK